MTSASTPRVTHSSDCAERLRSRCEDIISSGIAARHPLCDEALRLAEGLWVRQSYGNGAARNWPALMQARIRDTWQTKPAALNWLEDKLIQGPTAQELLESPQLLHVPILLTLNKDDPEEPTRREAWNALTVLVRSLMEDDEGISGLVVKPRHGHDAIGVSVFTKELLRSSAGLDEATSRVWFSMEQAMRVSDDSWCRECWSLSQVPHGVVVQQLYACDHLVAGEDCPTLNTTTCDLTPKPSAANTLQKGKQHRNNKKGKRHAAGGAPDAAVDVADAVAPPATDGAAKAQEEPVVPVQVEPLPPSVPVPVIVKSNQKCYPIELRLHVLFGRVIGGTLRSHPNELWVDHHGLVHVFSDARGLAVTRGALRFRAFLLQEDQQAKGTTHSNPSSSPRSPSSLESEERPPPPKLHPLVPKLASLLHGSVEKDGSGGGGCSSSWKETIVPLSERLCAASGLDELRVDWLLGDVALGPRIGELSFMGAAFSGVPCLAEAIAEGYMGCVEARLRSTRG